MSTPLNEDDKQAVKELSERIKSVFDHEKVSIDITSALANVSRHAIGNIRKGTGTVHALVKVMRTMGYDVTFVRTRKKSKLQDNADSVVRLSKLKKISKNARIKKKTNTPSQAELRRISEQHSGSGDFL